MPVSDFDLLRLQVEALFTHDPNGRIRWSNEPDPLPAARFFLSRSKQGNLWRFRHDLPENVVRRLEELAVSEPVRDDLRAAPVHLEAYRVVLREHGELEGEFCGPAYRFPDELHVPSNVVMLTKANVAQWFQGAMDLQTDPLNIRGALATGNPCAVVIEQGIVASMCFSSRMSTRASEAGLETLPEFRGKGYAAAVVAGWARAVRQMGRIPLYSTAWDNPASQRVAQKLGLAVYGAEYSFT